MLKDAGLYQRQMLATGLLGTRRVLAEGVPTEVKWESRTLVGYDASITEYDGIGGNLDKSKGEFTVHYAPPLDDADFDKMVQDVAPDLLAKVRI